MGVLCYYWKWCLLLVTVPPLGWWSAKAWEELGRTQREREKWSVKPVFSRAQQSGSQPRSYLFYVHLVTPRLSSPVCVRTSGSLEVAVNSSDLTRWVVGRNTRAKRTRGKAKTLFLSKVRMRDTEHGLRGWSSRSVTEQ